MWQKKLGFVANDPFKVKAILGELQECWQPGGAVMSQSLCLYAFCTCYMLSPLTLCPILQMRSCLRKDKLLIQSLTHKAEPLALFRVIGYSW